MTGLVVDAGDAGLEGSPVAVSVTVGIKKPLTEDALLLYSSLIKWIHRVVCNVFNFIKNPDAQFIPLELPKFGSSSLRTKNPGWRWSVHPQFIFTIRTTEPGCK